MRSILLTILIVLGGVFGLQNVQEVPVTFLLWQTSTYLAVALVAALGLGVLIGVLLILPWGLRHRKQARSALAARPAPPFKDPDNFTGRHSVPAAGEVSTRSTSVSGE